MNSAEILAQRESQVLSQATTLVFKEVEQGPPLRAHLFLPPDDAGESGPRRAAALFFHSAAWSGSRTAHFASQAMQMAARGMVSILVELRQHGTHGTSPQASVMDARSAFRWVRHHADRLAVDPRKLAGVGAYSAGLVVLAAALAPGIPADEGDPPGFEGSPNLIALFGPIVEVDKQTPGHALFTGRDEIKRLSPMGNIRRGLPPTLILHGMADRWAPYAAAEKFASKMRWKRNECVVVPYEGREQGFYAFNFDPAAYESTLAELDRFFVKHGCLNPAGEADDPRVISGR